MTLQKSLNKSNFRFFELFGFTFKKNLPIIIIGMVLSTLIFPIYNLTSMTEKGFSEILGRDAYDVPGFLIVVWIISLVVAAILAVINLNFLHSKKASDMFLALPISRSGVILARLAAACVGSILPILSSTLLTSLLALFNGIEAEYIIYLLTCTLYMAVINICLIFIGSLFMTLTGHTFDTITSFLAVMAGLPVLVTIVLYYATNMLYGYSDNLINTKLIYGMSPVLSFALYGGNTIGNYPRLGRTHNSEYSSSYYVDYENENAYTVIFVVWLVLSVLALALTLILIKRRKSETAGEAYSFKFMPYVIQGLGGIIAAVFLGEMFTGFEGGNISVTYILFAVVGSCIASIIIGAIVNRGFKNTLKHLIIGVVCAALTIGYGVALKYDIFGFVSYIPKAEDVSTVQFGYYKNFTEYDLATTIYKDAEDIENFINVHNSIIETRNDNNEKGSISRIYIEYTLKNGKMVTRDYRLFDNDSKQELVKLVKNEKFLNNYTVMCDDIVTVYNEYYDSKTDRWVSNAVISFNEQEGMALAEAYIKDVRLGASETLNGFTSFYQIDFRDTMYFKDKNYEDLKSSEFNVGTRSAIRINKNFENTLNYLEGKGVKIGNLIATE